VVDGPDEPAVRPARHAQSSGAGSGTGAPSAETSYAAAEATAPGAGNPRRATAAATHANAPGLFDDLADRLRFRAFIRRHRSLNVAYRAVVAVLGAAIMVTGFALIPLPGPGWLIVFAGLALLATEFAWAERLLQYGRGKLQAWTQWMLRQSLAVRGLVTLLGLGVVVGVIGLLVRVQGVPGWLPVVG
jgi:uncharacterized protein (TIGR02611 family)